MPSPGQPPIHKNVAKPFWAHKAPVAVKRKKPNLINRTAMNWVSKKILPFLLNWKTTLAGVALILHGCSAIVQALLSFVAPYSPIAPLLNAITEPFYRPFRRFIPPMGNIDLSPLFMIIVAQVLLIPLAALSRMVAASFTI